MGHQCIVGTTHTLIHTYGQLSINNPPTGMFLGDGKKAENPEKIRVHTCVPCVWQWKRIFEARMQKLKKQTYQVYLIHIKIMVFFFFFLPMSSFIGTLAVLHSKFCVLCHSSVHFCSFSKTNHGKSSFFFFFFAVGINVSSREPVVIG